MTIMDPFAAVTNHAQMHRRASQEQEEGEGRRESSPQYDKSASEFATSGVLIFSL